MTEREEVSYVREVDARKIQRFEAVEDEAASERVLQVDMVGEEHDELDPLDVARTYTSAGAGNQLSFVVESLSATRLLEPVRENE